MESKYSKERIAQVNEYNRQRYDQIRFFVRSGEKEKIKKFAADRGESMNGFITKAIREAMGNG